MARKKGNSLEFRSFSVSEINLHLDILENFMPNRVGHENSLISTDPDL